MNYYETIKVRVQDSVGFIEIHRPEANNSINELLIEEFGDALTSCETSVTVVVITGSPEVFCMGADFKALAGACAGLTTQADTAAPLYDLWLRLATGPFVTISHVRGKANAGGLGFVAASDVVIAEESAQFSLSELLFGLYPACVLPFLMRRIGFQRAHYLTLTSQAISAKQACEWGLVDAAAAQSEDLLRRQLMRLRRLSKTAIGRYKRYVSEVGPSLLENKARAVAGNIEVFADAANLRSITRYVERGLFPWE